MAKSTAKNITLMSILGIFLTVGAAFTMWGDISEQADELVYTPEEAAVEHKAILLASEMQQQTQAGFNAYTLRQLLQQEIAILKLRISEETDEEELLLLQEELRDKQAFIRKLQEEERRQLIKGES